MSPTRLTGSRRRSNKIAIRGKLSVTFLQRHKVWLLETKEKWDSRCKNPIRLLTSHKPSELKVEILRAKMERENKLNFLGREGITIGRPECLPGATILLNYWVFEEKESPGRQDLYHPNASSSEYHYWFPSSQCHQHFKRLNRCTITRPSKLFWKQQEIQIHTSYQTLSDLTWEGAWDLPLWAVLDTPEFWTLDTDESLNF